MHVPSRFASVDDISIALLLSLVGGESGFADEGGEIRLDLLRNQFVQLRASCLSPAPIAFVIPMTLHSGASEIFDNTPR